MRFWRTWRSRLPWASTSGGSFATSTSAPDSLISFSRSSRISRTRSVTETISLVSGPAPATVENSSRELTSSPMRSAACVARVNPVAGARAEAVAVLAGKELHVAADRGERGLEVVARQHRERLEVGVRALEPRLLLAELPVDLLDACLGLDLLGEVGDVRRSAGACPGSCGRVRLTRSPRSPGRRLARNACARGSSGSRRPAAAARARMSRGRRGGSHSGRCAPGARLP